MYRRIIITRFGIALLLLFIVLALALGKHTAREWTISEVTVENVTGREVTNAVLSVRGDRHDLGTLPVGSNRTVEMHPDGWSMVRLEFDGKSGKREWYEGGHIEAGKGIRARLRIQSNDTVSDQYRIGP